MKRQDDLGTKCATQPLDGHIDAVVGNVEDSSNLSLGNLDILACNIHIKAIFNGGNNAGLCFHVEMVLGILLGLGIKRFLGIGLGFTFEM